MAEGAGDADRAERATVVEEALDADDRVQLQERERGRRTVEVDLALLELRLEVPREGIDVDLQAGDGERRLRADTGADASEGGALDRLVQLELAAPVVLVAEGVEAEDLLALLEQPDQRLRAPLARRVDRLRLAGAGLSRSSGFDKENAANVVASAVTATPVIATTVTLDDDPASSASFDTRLSVIDLDPRFAIANQRPAGRRRRRDAGDNSHCIVGGRALTRQ